MFKDSFNLSDFLKTDQMLPTHIRQSILDLLKGMEENQRKIKELEDRNCEQFNMHNQQCIQHLEKIKDLQELLSQQTLHTEILDKNWQSHHDAGLNCLKSAIGIDFDSSIPAMVYEIERLVARDKITDTLEEMRKNAMTDDEIERLMH